MRGGAARGALPARTGGRGAGCSADGLRGAAPCAPSPSVSPRFSSPLLPPASFRSLPFVFGRAPPRSQALSNHPRPLSPPPRGAFSRPVSIAAARRPRCPRATWAGAHRPPPRPARLARRSCSRPFEKPRRPLLAPGPRRHGNRPLGANWLPRRLALLKGPRFRAAPGGGGGGSRPGGQVAS